MASLDDIPDAHVNHDDWEVAAVARLTAADGAAGGGGLFSFRNGSYASDPVWAGLEYDFVFAGGGLGLGLVAGGKFKIRPSGLHKKWHKIKADRPFSAADLSGSSGRITNLMVAVYEVVYISAGAVDRLFHSQSISGFSFGLGGAVLEGVWKYVF